MSLLVKFIIMILMIAVSFDTASAIHCSQCNNRFGGIPNTCVNPKNMTGCMGCLKTLTKVKLRDSGYMDGWEKLSVVVSRVCMKPGSTYVKPEGCYIQQNNGGYTERCFCYTDNCNSRATTVEYFRLFILLALCSLAMTLLRTF